MDSKHTNDSKHKEQSIQDWMPTGWKDKGTSANDETKEVIPENSSEATGTGPQQSAPPASKRTGSKQRKESLE